MRTRSAPEKTRAGSRSASRTTSASEASSRQVRRRAINAFLIGAAVAALILAALSGYVSIAFAAETPPITLPDQIKELGTEHGLLGLGLAMALTTIGIMFGMLIKSWSDRRADTERAGLAKAAALAEQERDHLAALQAKDNAHAEDRAEWHAATTLLQEARVGQLREVLTGLNASTAHIQATQATIAERNSTASELTATIRELVQTVQSGRRASEEEMTSLRKRITDALEALGRKS